MPDFDTFHQGDEILELTSFTRRTFNSISQQLAGHVNIRVPPGKKAYAIGFGGFAVPPDKNSMHRADTDGTVNFQTSKDAKVIFIIQGHSTTPLNDFTIKEDAIVDAGTGTVKETVTALGLNGTAFWTSPLMDFLANKYITVDVTVGRITSIIGWVIE